MTVQMPSFLFESVVNGNQQGRYSLVGSQPALEVIAQGSRVTVLDHEAGSRTESTEEDPMEARRGGAGGKGERGGRGSARGGRVAGGQRGQAGRCTAAPFLHIRYIEARH